MPLLGNWISLKAKVITSAELATMSDEELQQTVQDIKHICQD